MNISRVVDESYAIAAKALVMGTSPQALARARERAFVKALAARLRNEYAGDDIRVFSRFGRGNWREFGAEQLLSDICVCRVDSGRTGGRQSRDFLFVTEALAQAEVELSRDWRREVQALNRLIAGSAAAKLMVTALPARGSAESLETLQAPFAALPGAASLALIPHPADWETTEAAPEAWRLDEGEWIQSS
ncbi:MAG: hypothetical protein F4X02_06265 [Chloroflexi bacterium]|nr:hypothetical protein [Chloroflexota bacterium]